MNTNCTKCKKASMPQPESQKGQVSGGAVFTTGFRCNCGHWNDLKRRKGYAEWRLMKLAENI